jgi:O-acetyl-ADP-ribose deacetylase
MLGTGFVDIGQAGSDSEKEEEEHDWEELSRDDTSQDLHEEPVELSSQAASVTDVRSIQSSSIDFDELSENGL